MNQLQNHRLILILFILLVVAMAAFVAWTRLAKPEPPELVPADPTISLTVPVSIYAYDARLDTDTSGNVLCSEKGLVAVPRTIPESDEPLRKTLELLFADPLTEAERARGLSTEFPLENVRLVDASVDGKEATIDVRDPDNKTSGGSCRVSIMRAQVEATAKQFDGVTHVRFTPTGVFEP